MSRGHTLIELAALLAILALVFSSFSPWLRRYGDTAAVVAARESLAGLIAETRVAAIGAGLAEVRVDSLGAWSIVGGTERRRIALNADLGVQVDVGRRSELVLTYDQLGIGRVASATIRFLRGDSERSLVVSGYGRVRRR